MCLGSCLVASDALRSASRGKLQCRCECRHKHVGQSSVQQDKAGTAAPELECIPHRHIPNSQWNLLLRCMRFVPAGFNTTTTSYWIHPPKDSPYSANACAATKRRRCVLAATATRNLEIALMQQQPVAFNATHTNIAHKFGHCELLPCEK